MSFLRLAEKQEPLTQGSEAFSTLLYRIFLWLLCVEGMGMEVGAWLGNTGQGETLKMLSFLDRATSCVIGGVFQAGGGRS